MTSKLRPLPYPVYFVNLHTDKFANLLATNELPSNLEALYEKCIDGVDIWTAQTFIHLKQRGFNVHFVSCFVPGKICVVSYHHLIIKSLPYNSYVVGCQYDCARPEICEQRIVLNNLVALDKTDHFVEHWPHPLLKQRDRSRGSKLQNIVFKGGACNLAKPFLDPAFHAELKSLGIEFQLSTENPDQKFRDWGDYTHNDAVLAVRNATERDLWVKPAVKLINAWQAGCPALLGPEPGYQRLRRSELDYIEVRSPKDVIAALKHLKENPSLYNAMVEHGLQRSKEFTSDRLALRWHDILSGPIAQGYEQWCKQSFTYKLFGRPTQFANRTIHHKRALKRHIFHRDNGKRLFEDSHVDPEPTGPMRIA